MTTFDLRALCSALDARRQELLLSWADLARVLGVSSSTLRRLGNRQTAEADGVLRMLSWLGKAPNDVAFGGSETTATRLPEPRSLRFDTRSMYVALDREREARGITWEQLAHQCGVESAAILTRLSKGGRTTYPNVARILTWLGPPASRFVRTVTP
jgi:transcriptional regulator with XRE-family HTH domain